MCVFFVISHIPPVRKYEEYTYNRMVIYAAIVLLCGAEVQGGTKTGANNSAAIRIGHRII